MAWPMLGSLLLGVFGCSGASSVPLGGRGAVGGEERTGCTAEPLEQCASQSIEGIDVFDGQGVIDWSAVAGSGIAFAMIKATQGTYDTQARFATNWAGARAAGVRRGAYHFFDPTDDGAAQAQRFLAAVGPLAPGDLPPMVDIECPDGDSDCLGTGAAGTAPAAAIAQRLWDWIDAVEAATGTTPVLYTFASYFTSNGIDTAGLGAYPLFLAQPSPVSAAGACFSVPAPWTTATMWQYSWSGSVPGIGGPVDRDRFLGSPADLQALSVARPGAAASAGSPDPGDGAAPAPDAHDAPDTGSRAAEGPDAGPIAANAAIGGADSGPPRG
jgi:lysozyme